MQFLLYNIIISQKNLTFINIFYFLRKVFLFVGESEGVL